MAETTGLTREEILAFFEQVHRLCRQCSHGQKGFCDEHKCLVKPMRSYHEIAKTRPHIVDGFLLREIIAEEPKPLLRRTYPKAT